MKISQVPREKMVDEDGYITLPWRRFFSEMMNNFLVFLSDEGYQLPVVELPVPATDYPRANENNKGIILYDSVTNKLIGNVNGTLKEIQTTNL